MGALFSALFGTPLTAVLVVMEVLALGHLSYSTFVPCLIAGMTAYGVSAGLGMEPERYVLTGVPALSVRTVLAVGALAVLCAVLSIAFCKVMHVSGRFMKERLKNDYVRIAAGGAAVILLTLLVGTRDYNGAGAAVIERAVSGAARPWDFALKLLFTAVTLSCGYKAARSCPPSSSARRSAASSGRFWGWIPRSRPPSGWWPSSAAILTAPSPPSS